MMWCGQFYSMEQQIPVSTPPPCSTRDIWVSPVAEARYGLWVSHAAPRFGCWEQRNAPAIVACLRFPNESCHVPPCIRRALVVVCLSAMQQGAAPAPRSQLTLSLGDVLQ
eukprot:gene15776-biopygen18735